jgi:agmatinase
MQPAIFPVPLNRPTFLEAERCDDLDSLEADIAIIAIPYNTPYDLVRSRAPSSRAPETMREQSLRWSGRLEHYDFEFGGPLLGGRKLRIVDCGDVAQQAGQYEENNRMATAVVKKILERGAVPFILGGDHATTIPVMRAYEGRGPICAVHVDAHLDWRDEINGVHDGLSSPMRRASELPWVTSMIQIGLRGIGSARQREVDDAANWGSIRVRAEELHDVGVEEVLKRVPVEQNYYISFDTDVLDPSIAPGVNSFSPGGLTYFQATNILRGVARKGRVVGIDFVEVAPDRDHIDMTSLTNVRLILNVLGELIQQGQVGRA